MGQLLTVSPIQSNYSGLYRNKKITWYDSFCTKLFYRTYLKIRFLFHLGLFFKDFLLILDIHTALEAIGNVAVPIIFTHVFPVNRIDGR